MEKQYKIVQIRKFLGKFEELWKKFKEEKRYLHDKNIGLWWNEFKYDLKLLMISLGKANCIHERRELSLMKNALDHFLQLMLQHPNDKKMVKQYFEYKKKVCKKQLEFAKEKVLKGKAEKFVLGDTPNREFFQLFQRKTDPDSKIISELIDECGISKTNTDDFIRVATAFYTQLFSEKNVTK